MDENRHKRSVEKRLKDSIKFDRARIQLGRISPFGLMEMSRQRLRPSLQERWTQDIGSLSTAVLRLIEEEAGKKKSGEVRAIVSSDMSVFLLNERRSRINEIEDRTNVRVVVVSDPTRSDNRFEVTRLRSDDNKVREEASYEIQDEVENTKKADFDYRAKKLEEAAFNISPRKKPKRKGQSVFSKIVDTFSGQPEKKKEQKRKPKPKQASNKGRKPNKNFKGQDNKRKPQKKAPQKKAPINKDKKQTKKPTTNKDKDRKKDIKKPQPRKKVEPSVKKDKVVKEKLNKRTPLLPES